MPKKLTTGEKVVAWFYSDDYLKDDDMVRKIDARPASCSRTRGGLDEDH